MKLIRKSAKKNTTKSREAVINEVFFYVMLDAKNLISKDNKIRAYI